MNLTLTITSLIVGILLMWIYLKRTGEISKLRIEPPEAKKRLDTEKGIILLDVRTREEYNENHIPGSTLIPLNVLAKEVDKNIINKQATIFSYCRSGNRSRSAVRILLRHGYTNVFDLGGIMRWPYKTVSGKK